MIKLEIFSFHIFSEATKIFQENRKVIYYLNKELNGFKKIFLKNKLLRVMKYVEQK